MTWSDRHHKQTSSGRSQIIVLVNKGLSGAYGYRRARFSAATPARKRVLSRKKGRRRHCVSPDLKPRLHLSGAIWDRCVSRLPLSRGGALSVKVAKSRRPSSVGRLFPHPGVSEKRQRLRPSRVPPTTPCSLRGKACVNKKRKESKGEKSAFPP